MLTALLFLAPSSSLGRARKPVAVKVPAPGGVSIELVKLVFKAKHARGLPKKVELAPGKLPKADAGVAGVEQVEKIKSQSGGRKATYLVLISLFTPRGAKSAGGHTAQAPNLPPPDILRFVTKGPGAKGPLEYRRITDELIAASPGQSLAAANPSFELDIKTFEDNTVDTPQYSYENDFSWSVGDSGDLSFSGAVFNLKLPGDVYQMLQGTLDGIELALDAQWSKQYGEGGPPPGGSPPGGSPPGGSPPGGSASGGTVNPSCTNFTAKGVSPSPNQISITFDCKFGTSGTDTQYGAGWPLTLTETTHEAYPYPGPSGQFDNSPAACSGSMTQTQTCTGPTLQGPGQHSAYWPNQNGSGSSGTYVNSTCNMHVDVTVTGQPPSGPPVTLGSASALPATC
jgi:hypothetical protein